MLLHSNILGQGPAFVILHGFLGMGDNWKTLGKQFSEEGFQVHLVDQRNHGHSFHDDEFNYQVLVKDLKAYCQAHQLNNIILLGHSMGGKAAMLFAVKYPDLVSKLIIADISPRFYPGHHKDILDGLSALDFDEISSRGEADEILQEYVPEIGTRQFLLKNLYWKAKGTLALRINLDVLKANDSEIGEELPMFTEFNEDTLFLRGEKSEYIVDQDQTLIKKHFPNSKIVTIANAGHWLHAENPKDFFESVMMFIK
ncbi:MAG TPA: alpha/beta fold hydrolase [Flavobacteriaceae bacterium]|nr:alpha/beta fold hydrolase [Flavobacteriaceae bacterium]